MEATSTQSNIQLHQPTSVVAMVYLGQGKAVGVKI